MDNSGQGKTVAELAELLESVFVGDGQVVIQLVADLESAGPGSVAFVETVKALEEVHTCAASCLISPDAEAAR